MNNYAYIATIKTVYPCWANLIDEMVNVKMSDEEISATIERANSTADNIISNVIKNYKMEYRKIDDLCEEGGKLISLLGQTQTQDLADKFTVLINGLLAQANQYYNENQKLVKDNERLIAEMTILRKALQSA